MKSYKCQMEYYGQVATFYLYVPIPETITWAEVMINNEYWEHDRCGLKLHNEEGVAWSCGPSNHYYLNGKELTESEYLKYRHQADFNASLGRLLNET